MMKLTNKSHTTSLWGLCSVVGLIVHEMQFPYSGEIGKLLFGIGTFLVAYNARDAKKSSQDEEIH